MNKVTTATLAALLGMGVQPLGAQEAGPVPAEDRPDTFVLNLGAFYILDTDATLSANRPAGVIGTSIDLERDLDVEEHVTVPRLDAYFRINPHHRIDFSYFQFEREGKKNLGREIVFRDETFTVDANVKTSFENEVWKLAYTWSFHHSDKVELGLSVGAHVTRYKARLRTGGGAVSETEEVTAPLPVLGFRLDYTITRNWHVLFNTESLYVEIGDELRGALNDLRLAVEWRPFQHVHFGLGTNRLTLNATVDEPDWRGQLDNSYRGVMGYAGIRF